MTSKKNTRKPTNQLYFTLKLLENYSINIRGSKLRNKYMKTNQLIEVKSK